MNYEYPYLKSQTGSGYTLEKRQSVVKTHNAGISLYLQPGVQIQEPIQIDYQLSTINPHLKEDNFIFAGPNSKATILLDYFSEEEGAFVHQGQTHVMASAGAQITIVKLQRLSHKAENTDVNFALLERDAQVQWFSIELGSLTSSTEYENILAGTGSHAQIRTLFLGDGNRRMEHGYQMIHQASHTTSDIKSHGALKDQSYNLFKGILDIRTGAKKSVAGESQKVLLLDKTVRADAQPVLLCGEEDVKANHAASAGQLEESKLYYLMSRGLTLKEAKKVIIEGSFQPMLDQLPIDSVKNQVQQEISRRLIHGEAL